MEYLINSAINQTWKLCTFAGFLALFLLTLLISNNSETIEIPDPSRSSNSVDEIDVTFITTTTTVSAPPPTTTTTTRVDFHPNSTTVNAKAPISTPVVVVVNATTTTTRVDFQPNSTMINAKAPISTPAVVVVNATTTTTRVDFQPNSTMVNTKGPISTPVVVVVNATKKSNGKRKSKCKMYEGKWVYNPDLNPRYKVNQCPFLEEKMSCRQNGRPDLEYEGWGWEANDCNIPLFDGRKMMKRLRGKRVIIAGDSLNRNMWESLACLLYTSISPRRAIVDARGSSYKVFKAKDYNFTLEFYWAPFLVNLDRSGKSGRRVVVLDSLVPSAVRWRGADVMVFNTGHWWTHSGKIKAWDLFQYEGKQVEQMKTELAYERALSTWAHWIHHNVDPTKTKVFFRSVSPEHKSKNTCLNASRPITDESYQQLFPRSLINVAESAIREMKGNATYLNITKLSSYRRDAHPSFYRFKDWKSMAEDEYRRFADCSHWCLPGLPDTWNRILYASLFFDNLSPGDLI